MNTTSNQEKALIGAAIGFGGAILCAVLAAIMRAVQPHLPAIRGFLLWLCDPRFAIGMAFGMVVAAGIAWCLSDLADDGGDL